MFSTPQLKTRTNPPKTTTHRIINFIIMQAIKTTATVDEHGNLHPDTPLPNHAKRVELIVMFPDSDEREIDRLTSGTNNPAFDFLNDPAEDIYTANDGRRIRK